MSNEAYSSYLLLFFTPESVMLNERNLGTPAFFIGWGRIAALMFVFVVGDLFISWAQGTPIVRVFALGVAALVWLIGRALRPPPG